MRDRISTIFRHHPLSFATYRACPIEKPISSSSGVIVLLHVVLDLLLFLLPGGVQCRAIIGFILDVILNKCPSHLIPLCFISLTMFLHLLLDPCYLYCWARKLYWSCVSRYCGRLYVAFNYTATLGPIQENRFHVAVVDVYLGSQTLFARLPHGLKFGECCTFFWKPDLDVFVCSIVFTGKILYFVKWVIIYSYGFRCWWTLSWSFLYWW